MNKSAVLCRLPKTHFHCCEIFMRKFSINFLWRHMNVKAKRMCSCSVIPSVVRCCWRPYTDYYIHSLLGGFRKACGCHWGAFLLTNTITTPDTNDVMESESGRLGIKSDKDNKTFHLFSMENCFASDVKAKGSTAAREKFSSRERDKEGNIFHSWRH